MESFLMFLIMCLLYMAEANPGTYVGCFNDNKDSRDLTSFHKISSQTSMDLQKCYDFCTGFNFMYMALQNGIDCRCDNGYGKYGQADNGKCYKKCVKNSGQNCGGDSSNAVYRIRNEPTTALTSSMMSLSTNNQKFSFSALGDWGKLTAEQRKVANVLGDWSARHNSQFVVAVGDNFYEVGVTSPHDGRFKSFWKDVYTHQSLQRPWIVIEGNHDYLEGNAVNQVLYGKMDKRWVMPGMWYSMHYKAGSQDIHFIFLDTYPMVAYADHHQVEWFKKEIRNSQSDWIIVMGHHPIASSGGHGDEWKTRPLYDMVRSEMVKHKAALYVAGHDHSLEHITDSTGIIDYVVSGSGSMATGKANPGQANIKSKGMTSKFFRSVQGFVGFDLEGDKVVVSYKDFHGNTIYQFTKTNPRRSGGNVIG